MKILKNNNLTVDQRIAAFVLLGEHMRSPDAYLQKLIAEAGHYNPWHTAEQVENALFTLGDNLNTYQLNQWVLPYRNNFAHDAEKTVGLILAGNIPLVGFHDILVCLIAGYSVQIKPSADDKFLITHLLQLLKQIDHGFEEKINFVERLTNFDLIMATGSNNTSRYFEYYFSHVPHIIRKNRNSVAVLNGSESKQDLQCLGHDIFDYFGLGCRNVSKLYVPEGYDFSFFFEAIEHFSNVGNHYKYHNNYDYNKSIYLVNGDKHLDNGFLLVKPDERIASPLAVIYYETYKHPDELLAQIEMRKNEIQCLVGSENPEVHIPAFRFGQSQKPALDDYADGVNTLAFLATYS